MWMGKIGNKSASFINHKHFHPGNRENLEKVWLAEEKHKAELKRQKEMREKLAEEIRITELKRQLREQEEQRYKQYLLEQKPPSKYQVSSSSSKLLEGASGLIITKTAPEEPPKPRDSAAHKLVVRSRYREDKFERGHSSVFGSFYDRDSGRWGYRCCKALERAAPCHVRLGSKGPQRGATSAHDSCAEETKADDSHSQNPADKRGRSNDASEARAAKTGKPRRRGNLSLAAALDKLKQMDALD
ncbi:step II splicing factor, putative [Babesia caballi]|uniref:Step II splicing factor, putative n=1 Tax=Babesia caballi TaxID=5871 RepID=A0AAV4M082_BABCB|nr:step II splicing factor, putative [Babesia caballi]